MKLHSVRRTAWVPHGGTGTFPARGAQSRGLGGGSGFAHPSRDPPKHPLAPGQTRRPRLGGLRDQARFAGAGSGDPRPRPSTPIVPVPRSPAQGQHLRPLFGGVLRSVQSKPVTGGGRGAGWRRRRGRSGAGAGRGSVGFSAQPGLLCGLKAPALGGGAWREAPGRRGGPTSPTPTPAKAGRGRAAPSAPFHRRGTELHAAS